jgi:hypothetical protein
MKVVVCPACSARNTAGGQCILCGVQLGSIPAACAAAWLSALGLGVGWGLFSWLTGIQALWFGLFFGVLVSGAVAHWSFGRGWAFQAIASLATFFGIVVGEGLLLLLLYRRADLLWDEDPRHLGLIEFVARALERDPWFLAFGVTGIMGGFWLWKQPASSEDG